MARVLAPVLRTVKVRDSGAPPCTATPKSVPLPRLETIAPSIMTWPKQATSICGRSVLSMAYDSPAEKLPFPAPTPPSGLPTQSRIESLSIRSNRNKPLFVPVLTVTV